MRQRRPTKELPGPVFHSSSSTCVRLRAFRIYHARCDTKMPVMGASTKNPSQVSFDFGGQVAIVTGAARGVGRALVHAFFEAGAKVIAAGREASGLTETCRPCGENVTAVVADISAPEGASAVVDAALENGGRLDICVNNAAVAPHTSLLEERVEVWDRVYAVNCRGTFLMTQAAARAMIPLDNGGRIINFSSGVSKRGSPGTAAYASSRAATESFSRVAAVELAPHNILVNNHQPRPNRYAAKTTPAVHGRGTGLPHPNAPTRAPRRARRSGHRRSLLSLPRRQLHNR